MWQGCRCKLISLNGQVKIIIHMAVQATKMYASMDYLVHMPAILRSVH